MNRLTSLLLCFLTACGCEVDPTAMDDGGTPVDSSTTEDAASPIDARVDGAAGDAGRLAAPTGLDAYRARRAVGLDWDEVVGADSYILYWSTEPGLTPATGTRLADVAPSYVHRDLEDDTTYHYIVTAVRRGGGARLR